MDLIPVIERIELPEIGADSQEEEDRANFINVFYFLEPQIFEECPNYFITNSNKKLKSTSDFRKLLSLL